MGANRDAGSGEVGPYTPLPQPVTPGRVEVTWPAPDEQAAKTQESHDMTGDRPIKGGVLAPSTRNAKSRLPRASGPGNGPNWLGRRETLSVWGCACAISVSSSTAGSGADESRGAMFYDEVSAQRFVARERGSAVGWGCREVWGTRRTSRPLGFFRKYAVDSPSAVG